MDFSLVQHLTLLFTVLSIIIMIIWGFQNKDKWLYTVPTLVWLLHVVLFYTFYLIDKYNILNIENLIFYSKWSSYVRFHAVFTIFASAFILTHFDEKIIRKIKGLWNKSTQL